MFTSRFIAQAIGAAGANDPCEFSSVQTDSRKVTPGSLFVALKGDLFDGHDFIETAIAHGAAGVICREDFRMEHRSVRFFRVQDTLLAYRRLGAAWRAKFSLPVIAVAGSVGKTTTKELLSAMLGGRFESILKTQASQNGFVGIPMTLLELRPEHEAAVIEIGIDEIGAMNQHLAIVNPGFAVVTAIGAEHLEKLVDIRTVAREENQALFSVFDAGGTVAINWSDDWIRPVGDRLSGPNTIAYQLLRPGQRPPTDPPFPENGITGRLSEDGIHLECSGHGISSQRFELPLRGSHNASNFLSAMSVALALGLSPAEIRRGLSNFLPLTGRSELRELPGPTPVICDYYNANPASMKAGIELLREIGKTTMRWACLGDMLELGPSEALLHRELAPLIIDAKIDHVLLLGPRMRALATELKSSEFAGTVDHYETHEALAEALIEGAKPRDAILIKGSRGMQMEKVWTHLEQQSRIRWSTTH